MSLRIGIVGGGFIGNAHIKGLLGAGADIVAVADTNDDQRERARSTHGVEVYRSAAEMFASAQLHAVSICTPNDLHAPLTIAALEAGLHVLCEKPMALNAASAREMATAAAANDRLLMMGFNQRFEPGIARMIALREEGALGEVYHGRTTQLRQDGTPCGVDGWFGSVERAGAGVAFDLGSHAIYRLWYAMGRPAPASVLAVTHHKMAGLAVDDFVGACIRCQNGESMILEASWCGMRSDVGKRTAIMGTRAGCQWHGDDKRFTVIETTPDGVRERDEDLDPDAYEDRYRHFVRCLTDGIPCACTAEDGVVIQRILDALVESSKSGRAVECAADEHAGSH